MTNYVWRVHIEIKSSFNPVSILMYASTDCQDAFDYLETRQHLNTKKRKVFVKQLGSKKRYYSRASYEAQHSWEQDEPPAPAPEPLVLPQQTAFEDETFKDAWKERQERRRL